MASSQDILGREPSGRGRWSPGRPWHRWLRPIAIGVAAVAGAGWLALTGGPPAGSPQRPAPTPAIVTIGGSPVRECGRTDSHGLAWGNPEGAPSGDGRLVQWRAHLCNRSHGAITVWSLQPASRSERTVGADQAADLHRSGVLTDPAPSLSLPGRLSAGTEGDVQVTSAVVDCDRQTSPAGLVATMSTAGGPRYRISLPVVLPGPSPAAQWCGGAAGGPVGGAGTGPAIPRLALLQGAAPTPTRSGSEVRVGVTLLNPNDVAITLTGLHSPSPGVTVTAGAAGARLDPGRPAALVVRLRIDSCRAIFLDAGWQLSFTGTVQGRPVRLTPVRLGLGGWQVPVARQVCPGSAALPAAAGPAALEVLSSSGTGSPELRMVQVVRNGTRQPLLLLANPVSPPGLTLLHAEVTSGSQSQIGRVGGAALTAWPMPAGATATLTFSYRLDADADPVCQTPPVDSWRAPVRVTTADHSDVVVSRDVSVSPAGPSTWRGGWMLAAGPSCAREVHRGHGAPFLLEAGGAGSTRGGRLLYPVTAYGLPGEPPATLVGVRLVGAYAGLD
ncbi:MAG: hypothetical protein M3042_08965, partial [Actinomycetota bacterium]|nr:hypothetical protein [Actinomycetota bacterium]